MYTGRSKKRKRVLLHHQIRLSSGTINPVPIHLATNNDTLIQRNKAKIASEIRLLVRPGKAQIPLCRLPRDVRNKPVTSPLAQIQLRRLPRSRRNGIWVKGTSRVCRGRHGEVGIVEFGHYSMGRWFGRV